MNRVEELRRVRQDIERLKDEEKSLSTPIFNNMGVIHNLYDVFCLSVKRQQPDGDPSDSANRKKFLYAVLYIFSPATLVGDVMRHKLRECVSAIIGCTPTGISRDYKTGLFFYSTYREFREDVDNILSDMLSVLGKNYGNI